MGRKIIYVDMDGVLCNIKTAYVRARTENPGIRYPQSKAGFFRNLPPISGGVEAVKALYANPKFAVYILTAPSIRNPLCYTEKRLWIEDQFGLDLVRRLIISPNKGLNKGDYLIDDFTTGKGQDTFEGKLLHFGSAEFPGWEEVLAYFKTTYS